MGKNKHNRHDPDGRKQRALEDVRSTLTDEELTRVKQVREFNDLVPGTHSYRIALFNDQLRQNRIIEETKIDKRIWTIQDLQNQNERIREQIYSGKITEELKPGVPMTEHELRVVFQRNFWLAEGEAIALVRSLAELRGIVGHFDIAKNIIITQEEFDSYAEKTLAKVKELGFDVLAKYHV